MDAGVGGSQEHVTEDGEIFVAAQRSIIFKLLASEQGLPAVQEKIVQQWNGAAGKGKQWALVWRCLAWMSMREDVNAASAIGGNANSCAEFLGSKITHFLMELLSQVPFPQAASSIFQV